MRKPFCFVLVLALVLVGSGLAFAGYDARGNELRGILAKKQLANDKERETLTRALDDYLRARGQCLDDLVRIVAETSDSRTEQERAWDDRLSGCKQDAAKLGDAIKAISGTPSIDAMNFALVSSIEEVKFFAGLEKVQVGERRDQLVANQKNVEEMTKVLDEKWRSLLDADNAIDEQQKQVVMELREIIDRAYDAADRERRTIKEQLVSGTNEVTKFAKTFGKPITVLLATLTGADLKTLEEALRAVKEAEKGIDAFAKIYLKTNQDYIARAARFAALLQSERGGIYVLFGGFRRDTENFIQKHGFDQAKVAYQVAKDAMASWASAAATSGQRSDADAFSRDVLAKLSDHLAATEATFNRFVSAHQGKFFGPVAPDIKEALTETRVWEDWHRTIKGKSLDARLREWRSEANTFFTVNLSGLSSEDQEYLRKLIQARVDELVRQLDEAAKIEEKFAREFARVITDPNLK